MRWSLNSEVENICCTCNGRLRSLVAPVRGAQYLSLASTGTETHMVHMHVCRYSHIHIVKKLLYCWCTYPFMCVDVWLWHARAWVWSPENRLWVLILLVLLELVLWEGGSSLLLGDPTEAIRFGSKQRKSLPSEPWKLRLCEGFPFTFPQARHCGFHL